MCRIDTILCIPQYLTQSKSLFDVSIVKGNVKVWKAGGDIFDTGQVRAAATNLSNTWAPPETTV